MPLFGTRGRFGKRSRVPIYVRELERFRTDILYETLREKGYAVSRESASIHTRQGNSLEDSARELRRILPPPRTPSQRGNKSWWLWALAIIGALLIATLGSMVFYVLEPEIFYSLFIKLKEYMNYFYNLIIVLMIDFITAI